MHQIRQILEHFKRGTGRNKTARLLSMSRNTIVEYRKRCALTGLSYEELLSLDDADLSAMLRNIHPPQASADDTRYRYLESRFSYFEAELRKTGVTKRILWEEYLKEVPDGYRYTRFCHFISQYDKKNGAVMRLVHHPGEELQVDFAGDKLSYIDKSTGEVIECEVLVCAMPYSHYMYAVALPSQKQDDFIAGLVKALHFLGTVPQVIKCDNLKSAVIKPDRYTPEFTQAMEYFAAHYGATAMATRVAKPRDKASVEKAVDVCYKRIYAPLRNQQFYSLNELNQAIIKQLNWHNDLPLQGKSYSRTQRFTIQCSQTRNLFPEQLQTLSDCSYIQRSENILITGSTGCGKSYLACALGNQACLMGHKVYYANMNRLSEKIMLAKLEGTFVKLLNQFAKVSLLILDDFGLQPLDQNTRLALLQLLEDRYGEKSTMIVSQLPISKWHDAIGEPTLADAIMDRITTGAHRIELKGESLRKKAVAKT